MTTTPTPKSSNIAGYSYAPEAQALAVQFRHGGHYVYHGVSASEFERMQAAESKGKFLAREIKGKFRFDKVHVHRDYLRDFVATTENYNGTPDSRAPHSLMGHGATPEQAVTDLAEKLSEYSPTTTGD